jgi:2-polyprenyl-6-methoxyphenol hydroxylase-like FAD-dependent oxidoreductase
VVIVGGGISHLTLVDCLQHANIDFAVLEGGEKIGLHPGVGVGVGPGGGRILDQVGIFADLEKHPAANQNTVLQDSEGRKFCDDGVKGFAKTQVRVHFSAISVLLYAMGREMKSVRVVLNIRILVSGIDYKSGKGLITSEDGSTYCSDVVGVMESIVWCMRTEK